MLKKLARLSASAIDVGVGAVSTVGGAASGGLRRLGAETPPETPAEAPAAAKPAAKPKAAPEADKPAD